MLVTLLSLLGLLTAAGGLVGAFTRFTSAELGLYLLLAGLTVMAVLFLPALMLQLRWGHRSRTGIALSLGIVALAAAGAGGYFWFQHPLNDLTTNTGRPPAFEHPVYAVKPELGASLLNSSLEIDRTYRSELAGEQNSRYPEIESLAVKAPRAEAFPFAEKAIREGFPEWRIVLVDPARSHLEAEIEQPWLHLVDDFVLELRESKKNPNISTLEFRIRNRFPLGDLGLSRKRMESVRSALAPAMTQATQKWTESEKAKVPVANPPSHASDNTALPSGPAKSTGQPSGPPPAAGSKGPGE